MVRDNRTLKRRHALVSGKKVCVCVCVFVCYHHHQQQHHHHKQPNEPRRQQLFALTQTNWAVSWSCRHLISDKLRAIALLKPLFVFVFCVCVCVCRYRPMSLSCHLKVCGLSWWSIVHLYIYLCLYIYSYSSSAWNVISNVHLLLLSFLVPLHKLLICYINNISMLLFVSRCMSESNDGRVGLIHWEITFRPLIQIIF